MRDEGKGGGMDLVPSGSTLDLQRINQEDMSSMNYSNNEIVRPCDKVKIALSLYKVQQNIYLLDFQRIEGIVDFYLDMNA
jgi:hypothetical protein